MHVLIAFLTAVAGLLYALERVGIDLGWLNPWAWKRRRAWRNQTTGNPVFRIDNPMDAIALLAAATAKIDGDISIEEKEKLKALYQSTFNMTEQDAVQLFGSSIFLLGPGDEVYPNVEKILKPSLEGFTDEQKTLSITLLREVAALGAGATETQRQFVAEVEGVLSQDSGTKNWG
ncbi:MAG: TerB family tellurite resistance protein [Pseudomonadota bacterium]